VQPRRLKTVCAQHVCSYVQYLIDSDQLQTFNLPYPNHLVAAAVPSCRHCRHGPPGAWERYLLPLLRTATAAAAAQRLAHCQLVGPALQRGRGGWASECCQDCWQAETVQEMAAVCVDAALRARACAPEVRSNGGAAQNRCAACSGQCCSA
jgi:hypothetical protein